MKALVTGCHGLIGQAIIDYFLQNNYHVTAVDKNVSRLQNKATSQLVMLSIDLSDTQNVESVFKQIDQPFDVVVYAAGIREIQSATTLALKEWHDILSVNLGSAFVISQQIARLAIQYQKPLCLIYISSISGLQGESERSAYCASKHGLIGLAKSLAIELAPHAIRANVIAPGVIETEMTQIYQSDSILMQHINQHIPLKRWGQPQHIVQCLDMIIRNDYLTGSTITVDGGWMAGKDITRNM
jgi:NAD(P)-dependent dehydrogenase (short-subunit alcohol dehydrogenase family)